MIFIIQITAIIVTIGIALISAFSILVSKIFNKSLKAQSELRNEQDTNIKKRISDIEKTIKVKDFVSKADHEKKYDSIINKLDSLDSKFDSLSDTLREDYVREKDCIKNETNVTKQFEKMEHQIEVLNRNMGVTL